MEDYLYKDLTEKIIGCCFAVYNELKYGYPEKTYQNAIASELEKKKLTFQRESYSKILYDGKAVGRFFLDFLVEDKVALEIKVRRQLYPTDWAQLLNYFKAKKLSVGLLAGYTPEKVVIKRLIN